ncbi:Putative inorganic phosphate cotransporter-like Protein [Tribolium castaneum]|uniref:Inorganic phosphate cotransporter-like Protein n=1 Tax=Tribolium castaneum TaxID=7070 RepID=D6WXY7_TRICA|nr:PREDICTED: putative inorganic phosphate cotransporter [Tribolium castaneum]EFA08919.1 Putative inorganic phosphate cotransporter-like Protein [Tribolium castaneum]|eukprot:XP_015838353.1 PREDICTED: putative inorganic phosphate cotransporter [Tribolium castaneum]
MFAIRNEDFESDSDSNFEDEDELTRIIPPEVEDTRECMKARHILGILGFLGFANVYAMRVNLSVAIVAMVNNTAIPQPSTNSNIYDHCLVPNATNSTQPNTSDGEFAWDEAKQGIVLGSFFYGYVLTQVPGGRLAELFGGKLVYGVGVLVTAVFTLLSPIAARINFPLFILVRVLEGMGEGVTFPSMHAMLARWIPPLERSKFAAYVYAGANFGTVISLPLSGWLCSLELDGGWPLCFYLFGFLGIIWFVFWCFLIYDSPSSHPRINPQERAFILASIGPQDEDDKASIPWLKMLTCVPLWAILITQCGQSWAFYTQLTELPTYMSQILHFDIQANAFLSAIPYLTSWWCGILISFVADWLLSRGYLSLSTSYKVFNSLASIVPSLGILGVAYVGCDRVAVQLLLAIPGALAGAVYAGNQMNHIALSPKYAGTMYGITNAASNMCGFLAPYVIGVIIEGRETLGQWRLVFYLAAGINIGANLFYIAFASAREQPWSRSQRLSTIN